MKMARRIVLVTLMMVTLAGVLTAGTSFTTPVIVVSPPILKLGGADARRSLTNSFLVENIGRGKLVGKATVNAPFKIIDGASYNLKENEAQVVTIVYLPTNSITVTNVVKFTGGGGAEVKVVARPLKLVSP
jgi:hypothetical protein